MVIYGTIEIDGRTMARAKAPKGELLHYYDGTLDNGMLMDLVGNWHLTATSGSTIENETPWS